MLTTGAGVRAVFVSALVLLLFAAGLAHANHPMGYDHRAFAADPATATGPIAPRLSGLGDYSFKVSTQNPGSQYFFDQGLRLTYGFNHSEALRAFKESVRLDPTNAMGYWGWALVLGPNLNMPMDPLTAEQAYSAVQEAVIRAKQATPLEQALINALAQRYAPVAPDDRSSLDAAYAGAMREVVKDFPDALDARTFLADALMNLSPWNYWHPDGTPRENTDELLLQLDVVLAKYGKHPGALHLHIHAMEAAHPDRAVISADDLRGLMPSAGHMEHMPSHIYMRVGRYAESFEANRLASLADESYIAQCKQQGIYPLNYYPHNLHFLMWSAIYQGRSQEALQQARKVVTNVPLDADGKAMAPAYETFMSQPLFVMVRFGMWDALKKEPAPAAGNVLATAIWRYAHGTALARTGDLRKAEKLLKAMRKAEASGAADAFPGYPAAGQMMRISSRMLAGEVAAARGDNAAAIAEFGHAVRIEDSMQYTEPSDWLNPTRHQLGNALLAAGEPAEAAVVFWEDLKRFPESAFALHGLEQSYRAQGDATMADAFGKRFDAAWKDADLEPDAVSN